MSYVISVADFDRLTCMFFQKRTDGLTCSIYTVCIYNIRRLFPFYLPTIRLFVRFMTPMCIQSCIKFYSKTAFSSQWRDVSDC